MQRIHPDQPRFAVAIALALALHALVLAWAFGHPLVPKKKPEAAKPQKEIVLMSFVAQTPEPPEPPLAKPSPSIPPPKATQPAPAPKPQAAKDSAATPAEVKRPLATREAPPAPTAEEWAFAAQYPLKNSKGYRHNWGQQVRSLMGTAVEGPDQGAVRFRIEIAPDGRLVRLDTLWSTSTVAEQRARQAVAQMPPLPPTPNGKPLIFEKTILFDPHATDAPPLYKYDCEPDPAQHRNRFVWDGRSPQVVAEDPVTEKLDPVAYAECQKLLPKDSIEAEAASDDRQQKVWASPRLGR